MDSFPPAVFGSVGSILSGLHGEDADDRELLRRFVEAREDDAFAALLRRHGPMVLGLARRVVGDGQLAEDVFQAAFLLLARKAHTIRRPEALSCWLHGVAFRLALRVRRSRCRHQERESRVHRPPPTTPLDELTAREFLSVLDEELQKLPENYRAPLILCCLEGLSQDEAAKRLGCSAGAVKGRLERGRNQLRVRLQKRGLMLPTVFGSTFLIVEPTGALPPALIQAAVKAARTGAATTSASASLVAEAMRHMAFNKLKAIGAAAVLLAVTGGGLAMIASRPAEDERRRAEKLDTPAAKSAPVAQGKDLYGDPLPPGAVMRLGTLRQRAVEAQLAVSADGKLLISVRGGKGVRIWDAATGELRQQHELPGEAWGMSALSADGQWLARIALRPEYLVEIWDVQKGRKLRDLTIKDSGLISLVAFSADGKRIAADGYRRAKTASGERGDPLVRAWEAATGKEIFATDVRNNNLSIGRIAFAPGGQRLLGSFNSVSEGMYCWDIASGRRLWQNKEYSHTPIAFTPDGKVFSVQQRPWAVDLETGQKADNVSLPPYVPHTHLALAPDGRTLLLASYEGVIVWDLKEGKELRRLKGAGTESVVLPDSKSLIANNGALQRWDLATGQPRWTDTSGWGHLGEVAVVKFSADGKRLVSASTDGTVRLWDTTTSRPLRVWRVHRDRPPLSPRPWLEAGVTALDISADGRRIVSAGGDEFLKLWDIASDQEFRTIPLPRPEQGELNRRIYHVRIRPDGGRIFGSFGPRGFRWSPGEPTPKRTDKFAAWDAQTGALLETHPVDAGGGSGIYSPDGHTLLTSTALIDVLSAKKIAEPPGWDGSGSGEFSRDGALIVGAARKMIRVKGVNTITPDGLGIWEAATGKLVARLQTKTFVASSAFHPDNRFVATNDFDGVHLRDVRSGENLASFTMPESIPTGPRRGSYAGCLTFSPDGRRMATGMPDGTILLWDVSLPPSKPERLETKELETLWADLVNTDAAKAWRAVWRMADDPAALPFLQTRLKPVPTAPADVARKLLTDLDGDSFEAREAAVKRLKELGVQAEPALRAALQAKPSLEQKRRIEALLAELIVPAPLTPEELRQLRALIVLERIGSPQARRLLEEMANGPQSARLTRQARAALRAETKR